MVTSRSSGGISSGPNQNMSVAAPTKSVPQPPPNLSSAQIAARDAPRSSSSSSSGGGGSSSSSNIPMSSSGYDFVNQSLSNTNISTPYGPGRVEPNGRITVSAPLPSNSRSSSRGGSGQDRNIPDSIQIPGTSTSLLLTRPIQGGYRPKETEDRRLAIIAALRSGISPSDIGLQLAARNIRNSENKSVTFPEFRDEKGNIYSQAQVNTQDIKYMTEKRMVDKQNEQISKQNAEIQKNYNMSTPLGYVNTLQEKPSPVVNYENISTVGFLPSVGADATGIGSSLMSVAPQDNRFSFNLFGNKYFIGAPSEIPKPNFSTPNGAIYVAPPQDARYFGLNEFFKPVTSKLIPQQFTDALDRTYSNMEKERLQTLKELRSQYTENKFTMMTEPRFGSGKMAQDITNIIYRIPETSTKFISTKLKEIRDNPTPYVISAGIGAIFRETIAVLGVAAENFSPFTGRAFNFGSKALGYSLGGLFVTKTAVDISNAPNYGAKVETFAKASLEAESFFAGSKLVEPFAAPFEYKTKLLYNIDNAVRRGASPELRNAALDFFKEVKNVPKNEPAAGYLKPEIMKQFTAKQQRAGYNALIEIKERGVVGGGMAQATKSNLGETKEYDFFAKGDRDVLAENFAKSLKSQGIKNVEVRNTAVKTGLGADNQPSVYVAGKKFIEFPKYEVLRQNIMAFKNPFLPAKYGGTELTPEGVRVTKLRIEIPSQAAAAFKVETNPREGTQDFFGFEKRIERLRELGTSQFERAQLEKPNLLIDESQTKLGLQKSSFQNTIDRYQGFQTEYPYRPTVVEKGKLLYEDISIKFNEAINKIPVPNFDIGNSFFGIEGKKAQINTGNKNGIIKTFYHGTSKENAENILIEGLKPAKDVGFVRGVKGINTKTQNDVSKIFLARNQNTADIFAKRGTVLEVGLTSEQYGKTKKLTGTTITYEGKIPKEQIKRLNKKTSDDIYKDISKSYDKIYKNYVPKEIYAPYKSKYNNIYEPQKAYNTIYNPKVNYPYIETPKHSPPYKPAEYPKNYPYKNYNPYPYQHYPYPYQPYPYNYPYKYEPPYVPPAVPPFGLKPLIPEGFTKGNKNQYKQQRRGLTPSIAAIGLNIRGPLKQDVTGFALRTLPKGARNPYIDVVNKLNNIGSVGVFRR